MTDDPEHRPRRKWLGETTTMERAAIWADCDRRSDWQVGSAPQPDC